MGLDDWLKDTLTPGFVKQVNTALIKPDTTSPETKTPQQLQYEAKEKAMNSNNPYYQNVNKPITTEPVKPNENQ